MFRTALVFLLAAVLAPPLFSVPQKDINAILGDSEDLYFQAKFRESLELLVSLDDRLRQDHDHTAQRARVKLQIALSYLGLDQVEKAKASLVEMCALEPNCAIDADDYSPKVLTLFQEARAEALGDARLRAAEQAYRSGMESSEANDMVAAVERFRQALQLNPQHVQSAQYLTLALEKLHVVVDQKVLEWRKDFDSGNHTQAAADYRELERLNLDGIGDPALQEIRAAYRNRVTTSLQAWNSACKSGDAGGMERAHREADLILPNSTVAQDLTSQMASCTAKPCVRMDVQSVMRRVKTSVEPEIPSDQRRALQNLVARTVQVNARIDETGDVSVLSVRGLNRAIGDAVSSSVEKWKFFPTVIENESRCVETVFSIVLPASGSN